MAKMVLMGRMDEMDKKETMAKMERTGRTAGMAQRALVERTGKQDQQAKMAQRALVAKMAQPVLEDLKVQLDLLVRRGKQGTEANKETQALVVPQANRANKVYLARKENTEYVVCRDRWAAKAKKEKLGVLGNKVTWAPRACVENKEYKV